MRAPATNITDATRKPGFSPLGRRQHRPEVPDDLQQPGARRNHNPVEEAAQRLACRVVLVVMFLARAMRIEDSVSAAASVAAFSRNISLDRGVRDASLHGAPLGAREAAAARAVNTSRFQPVLSSACA